MEGLASCNLERVECVFRMKDEHREVVILVYVDDFVILCTDIEGISRVKSKIQSLFNWKELGEPWH